MENIPRSYRSVNERRPPLSARIGTVHRACALAGIRISGRVMARCPACGREAKAAVAGRLSTGEATRIAPSGRGWYCHACHESGGSAELVAWAWYGRALRDLDSGPVREMSARIDRECGTEPVLPAYTPPPSPEELARRRAAQPILWRGQPVTWRALYAAWVVSIAVMRDLYLECEVTHG